MSRRISSRDDLFLSALDMYTLLSLAFIGFAFFVSPSSDSEKVDLPIARGEPDAKASPRMTVQWAKDKAPKDATVSPSAECQLQVVGGLKGTAERDRTYPAACVPDAFGGTLGVTKELRLLRDGTNQTRPEVAILCRREDGLLACASLQWVMHEAGFRPLAGVSPQH